MSDQSKLNDNNSTCGDSSFNGSTSAALNSESYSVCVGCGNPIQDQYILRVAPNLEWHARCLKCSDCGQYLDENCTCFVRNGKAYCKKDFTRLFGTKCGNCGMGVRKDDLVMRAKDRVYHMDCFRCVVCRKQLLPGEECALRDDGILCKSDYNLSLSSDIISRAPDLHHLPGFSPGSHSSTSSLNGLHTPSGLNAHHRNGGPGHKRKDTKTTRVRTVLNEKQLLTLRTCYAANCRPDALMKEQLTEMTGLSARVIRVWFQNKRCKDKKRSLALKQMQEQQAKQQKNGKHNGGSNGVELSCLNGIPMIASEPVRNDTANPKPVEVQNYQQSVWKTLSDFALQSDLDQPAFQQLIGSFSDQGLSSTSDSSDICSIPSVSSPSVDISTTCSTPAAAESSASVCG